MAWYRAADGREKLGLKVKPHRQQFPVEDVESVEFQRPERVMGLFRESPQSIDLDHVCTL